MTKIFKLFSLVVFLFLAFDAHAAPTGRFQRGIVQSLSFEFRNSSTGALISAATAMDCEISKWALGGNPGTFVDASGTETEIATTSGAYFVAINATESSADFLKLKCTSSSTNAVTAVVDFVSLGSGDGAFQAGSTTALLNLAAGETSNDITGQSICVQSGNAAKDCCLVTAYNTTSKVATCGLTTAPASGDVYSIGGPTSTGGGSITPIPIKLY